MAVRRNTAHAKRDRFDIDHDHITGVIRGLLCSKCNRGLGAFGDSPKLIRQALIYLKSSRHPFAVKTEWLKTQDRLDPDSEQW